ncbi:hypothetical protein OSTOST_06591 [Ostertagia ostertagi]
MESDAISALSSLYESVDDIDLFPGLVSERPLKGALLVHNVLHLHISPLKMRSMFSNDGVAKLAQRDSENPSIVDLLRNSRYLRTIQPNVFDVPDDLIALRNERPNDTNGYINACHAMCDVHLHTRWGGMPSSDSGQLCETVT